MVDQLVLNSDQLRCLASPACHQVLETLRSLGEATVAQIARSIEKTPGTVHHHIKTMVSVGLVEESHRRPSARRPEVVYRSAAQRFSLPSPESEPSVSGLSLKAVEAGVRQSMRGFAASKGSSSNRMVIRAQVRLSEADTRTFLEMIQAANRFAVEHQGPDGELVHWMSLTY